MNDTALSATPGTAETKQQTKWTVEGGSVVIKIYLTPSGERELFTISYWIDGKRHRQVFQTLKEAKAEARNICDRLSTGKIAVAKLTAADCASYDRARQLLDPIGVSLEMAASEYADAFKKLKGRVSLAAAVEYYLRRNPEPKEPMLVPKVVQECLTSKRQDKLSDRYLKQLEYDLNRFATRFSNNIEHVAGVDIDTWLRSLDVTGRTRNNIRASIQTLFSYAKGRRYIAKDHDELDAVPVAKDMGGEIGIFRPAELEELLKAATPEMVPFLVLGAFAGIRHAEIQRLDWQDVKMDAGIIEIRAAKAKTASRRTIPITPNLKAWLTQYKKECGAVCPYINVTEQLLDLMKLVNKRRKERGIEKVLEWQHNGLRHSFISYRVADVQNVAQVALEAGNSPAIIFRNYRELVTPADAKAWFAIQPAKNDKKKRKSKPRCPVLKQQTKQQTAADAVPMPTAFAA